VIFTVHYCFFYFTLNYWQQCQIGQCITVFLKFVWGKQCRSEIIKWICKWLFSISDEHLL